MKKGYWSGHVFEIKNEKRWNNYLAKYTQIEEKHKNEKTGNYVSVLLGQPKEKIQGSDLMYGAVVEFNSLQDAIDCYNSKEYQEALIELSDNPEDTVIRNLTIFEGI
jgi:uncharacterized protein (DUF1330 family)